MSVDTKNTGLRGIPVADTRISNINGKLGKLIYRGYDIEDLAEKSTFEETAYLLLHDHLPTKARYNKFLLNLNDSRVIPKQMQTNMCNWRKDADPMDMLQAFVAALAGYYDEEFSNKEASYERAVNIIAKVPTILAYMEVKDMGASGAVNFVLGLSGKNVGIAYKERTDKGIYAISVRGSSSCPKYILAEW